MSLRIKRMRIYHESRNYYNMLKTYEPQNFFTGEEKNECLFNNNTSRLRINKIERERKEKEKCHSGAILSISHTFCSGITCICGI